MDNQEAEYQEEAQEPVESNEQENDEHEGGQGFTINADQIEESIKQQMDDKQEKQLDRLLDEGNNLLFGKDTHYQLLSGLENSKNIAKDLGEGAYNMMMSLIKQGANVPGEIIPAAGAILMARVAEFINQSGMATITDDDYGNAVEMFGHLIMRHDPQFMERMKQNIGQTQPQEMAQGSDMSMDSAGQISAQQPNGLLNMTGNIGG